MDNLTKCNDFKVVLPNGDIISAIEEGTLTLSTDPVVQVTGYVFEDVDLKQSLLGLSPLTNEADCQITMDKNELVIMKNDKIIARTGKRADDQLWSLEVGRQKESAQANLSLRLESDAEYVAFAHEAFGSPAVSTFHNAVSKGYLGNYPRLTAQMIAANRPNTVATAKGHLDQTRKGMWSTNVRKSVTNVKVKKAEVVVIEKDTDMDGSAEDLTDVDDIAPEEEASEVVYTKIIDVGFECHSDAPGRIPTESFEGNKYVLVSVYDNYIMLQAYRDRSAEEYVRTYEALFNFLESKKKKVSLQRLDNEKSGKLEEWFKEKSTKFSYVSPGNHRVLRAERAIRSAKNHIIATLCTADDNFPAYLWDKLLDQAEMTLNHMRVCRSNEKVSAYEGMHGTKYDFMAHPIAPAGIKVVVHDKPDQRPSWAAHGVDGYYLGPALDHYRCWRTWITRTQSVRVSDTIAWFPARARMPGVSALDALSAAITDVDTALDKVAEAGPAAASRQPYVALQQTAIESLRNIVKMFTPTMTPEEPVEPLPQRVEAGEEPALQRVEEVNEPAPQRIEVEGLPPKGWRWEQEKGSGGGYPHQ